MSTPLHKGEHYQEQPDLSGSYHQFGTNRDVFKSAQSLFAGMQSQNTVITEGDYEAVQREMITDVEKIENTRLKDNMQQLQSSVYVLEKQMNGMETKLDDLIRRMDGFIIANETQIANNLEEVKPLWTDDVINKVHGALDKSMETMLRNNMSEAKTQLSKEISDNRKLAEAELKEKISGNIQSAESVLNGKITDSIRSTELLLKDKVTESIHSAESLLKAQIADNKRLAQESLKADMISRAEAIGGKLKTEMDGKMTASEQELTSGITRRWDAAKAECYTKVKEEAKMQVKNLLPAEMKKERLILEEQFYFRQRQ